MPTLYYSKDEVDAILDEIKASIKKLWVHVDAEHAASAEMSDEFVTIKNCIKLNVDTIEKLEKQITTLAEKSARKELSPVKRRMADANRH